MRFAVAVLAMTGMMGAGAFSARGAVDAQQPKSQWDGVYTEAQATRGMMAFSQSCAGCHALAAEGRAPLVGDAFWKSFAQKRSSPTMGMRTSIPRRK